MPCEESDSVSSSVICNDQHKPPAKQLRLESDHDILSYMSVAKTVSNKYQLTIQCFVPENTYKFPKDANIGHSFQYRWLAKYPWLRYSKRADGEFCLACAFFQSSNFCSDPNVLVTTPLTDFKRALEKLDQHSNRAYHKFAIVKMNEFVKVMTRRQGNIQVQLDDACAAQIAKNRQKIQSIVETVILCGRQNILLRGHRDSMLDLSMMRPQAMVIFGHCCSFEQLQVIWFLEIILHMPLEMHIIIPLLMCKIK